jgi:hypothetical protein
MAIETRPGLLAFWLATNWRDITAQEMFARDLRLCSKLEIDTPSNRTAFCIGMSALTSPVDTFFNSLRLPIVVSPVRLHEISSKSANFTLSVTVRPRAPFSSQCRQTLSIGVRPTMRASSVRSVENVFSAPTDFRTLSVRRRVFIQCTKAHLACLKYRIAFRCLSRHTR